jgi:hypothetical protein
VSAVTPEDAEYGACGAMSRITRATKITLAAARIYFSNDALADECAVGALFYQTDKFVSDCALEAGIATSDFEIGIADARKEHTHERFAGAIRFFDLTD